MPNTFFDHIIKPNVERIKNDRGIDSPRAFAIWVLTFVQNISEDDAVDQTDTMDAGDNRLDGYHADDTSSKFYLWQMKWTDSGERQFNQSPVEEICQAYDNYRLPEHRGRLSEKGLDIALKLDDAVERGYAVVLAVAVAGSFSEHASAFIESTEQQLDGEVDPARELEIWGLNEFDDEASTRDETGSDLAGVIVKFPLTKAATLAIDSSDGGIPDGWAANVVQISGRGVAEAVAKYKSKLFGLNVRYGLSGKKRANNSMSKTATDPHEAKFFFFYNNGLTAICDSFEFVIVPEGVSYINVANPQIVNGCQTASMLRKALKRIDDATSVLARFIQKPTGDQQQQLLRISENTNTQTAVSPRDLRSNDKVQRDIQRRFRELTLAIFCERKAGEWSSLTPAQKDKFRTKPENFRKTTNELVGQSVWMITDPAGALTRKKELFADNAVYTVVFRPDRHIDEYRFALRIREACETLWSPEHIGVAMGANPGVFGDDFLLRASVVRGQLVSHSVWLVGQLIFGAVGLNSRNVAGGMRMLENNKFEHLLGHIMRILYKKIRNVQITLIKKELEGSAAWRPNLVLDLNERITDFQEARSEVKSIDSYRNELIA